VGDKLNPYALVLGASTRVRPPRQIGRAEVIPASERGVLLDENAVSFLGELLPPPYGDDVIAEASRRRLGGSSRSALSDRGFVLEFSRPFHDQETWKSYYNVRVMKRPRMTDWQDLELLELKTIPSSMSFGLRATAREVGIKVLNPRRGRETDKDSAGKFDHELGLTGRL
jgi:hypothetical protein